MGLCGLQILAGLYQYQGAFIQDHHWRTFARHVHRLGFCGDCRLNGSDAFGIGVDPFQTTALRHGLHFCHRQCEGLNAGHAGTCGCMCCFLLRFFARCMTWGTIRALATFLVLSARFTRLTWLTGLLWGLLV